MLVKSSILVHTNSTVSLSPLPACLPPLCLLSFRFRTFYRAAVPTHVRNRPRFLPPLLICSRSARVFATRYQNPIVLIPSPPPFLTLLDFDLADLTCVSTGFLTLVIGKYLGYFWLSSANLNVLLS